MDIVQRLKNIEGIKTVAMTTNGLTLSRRLPALVEAGLDALNIRYEKVYLLRFQVKIGSVFILRSYCEAACEFFKPYCYT